MTISFTRYVDITSGVGGESQVSGRKFIGRLFTTNELLPPQTIVEFSNLDEVGSYFGTSSEEYTRAAFYFGWVSKSFTKAQSISYARWVDVATAPKIFGAVEAQLLATYTAIADGSLGLTIGVDVNVFTGLDFTLDASLSDVATTIQTAINLAAGAQWTGAVVTWEALGGYFKFVGGDAVDAVITVQEGVVGTPIAATLGWLAGATLSNGSLAESITDTLQDSYAASNNYGTFLFIPSLSIAQITEAAVWNSGLNVRSMYTVPVTIANEAAYRAALQNYGGVEITVSEIAGQYPEQAPMMIFAATNYEADNSVQNYMYQQFALTASVSDDTVANTLDADRINYYGITQQAGSGISFYQTGVLQGLAEDPQFMNIYANEMWLKDAMGVVVMNLQLAVTQIPANNVGALQISTVLSEPIQQALSNGTIEPGKTFNAVQKEFINNITNDPNAFQQVQTLGYWLSVVIESFVEATVTKYKAVYTLIYSKDDVVSKVEGSHILV